MTAEARQKTTQNAPMTGLGPRGENLSIMIPNYNGAKYIEETLDSIKHQGEAIRDAEIIVMDNCSTDDSLSVIERVGGGTVQYHQNNHNLGMIGNFNACISTASRNWIHILHSDDVLLPNAYVRFNEVLKYFPESNIVFARSVMINDAGEWFGETPLIGKRELGQLQYDPSLWRFNITQFVSTIFTKASAELVGGFNENMHYSSDWNLWWRIARLKKAAYSNHHTGLYRSFNDNTTNKLSRTGRTIYDNIQQICQLLDCPMSSVMITQRGESFFYEKVYEYSLQQCRVFLGNEECFAANFREMAQMPRAVFSKKDRLELKISHLRHRLNLKRRISALFKKNS